jgi:hypothetical protein
MRLILHVTPLPSSQTGIIQGIEKEEFKKRPSRFLWISNTTKRGKEFEIVSLDESFFILLLRLSGKKSLD